MAIGCCNLARLERAYVWTFRVVGVEDRGSARLERAWAWTFRVVGVGDAARVSSVRA